MFTFAATEVHLRSYIIIFLGTAGTASTETTLEAAHQAQGVSLLNHHKVTSHRAFIK